MSFIDNPLGWGRFFFVDLRYFNIYLLFIFAFIVGQFAVILYGLGESRNGLVGDREGLDNRTQQALLFVYSYAIFCALAVAFKSGGFALLASDRILFRANSIGSLGGFIAYPATLITPLAALALYQFSRSKQPRWLILYLTSLTFQILNMNRQEILILLIAPFFFLFFFRPISFSRLIGIILGGAVAFYTLGLLAVVRVGDATAISKLIPVIELPFWLVLSDLAYAVQLAHSVIDQIGAAALHGTYVFGVFINVIFPNYESHGASAIQAMFTEAETAQSIGAPFSYFVDGGIIEVAALGFTQGFVIHFFYRKAQGGSLFFRLIYILNFLYLLWTIRSGTISVNPMFLYQLGALTFILSSTLRINLLYPPIVRVIASVFLLTIPVSLLALAMRV